MRIPTDGPCSDLVALRRKQRPLVWHDSSSAPPALRAPACCSVFGPDFRAAWFRQQSCLAQSGGCGYRWRNADMRMRPHPGPSRHWPAAATVECPSSAEPLLPSGNRCFASWLYRFVNCSVFVHVGRSLRVTERARLRLEGILDCCRHRSLHFRGAPAVSAVDWHSS